MEQEDSLREIPPEDFQPLLDDLKTDFPNSIHAWSFLRTIERWRVDNPKLCAKILAINGDYRMKFIVFFVTLPDLAGVWGSMHKWSHLEDDVETIRKTLKNCKQFPWDTECVLTAMTEESDRAVIPVLQEIWKHEFWSHEQGHSVYWVSQNDALKWEIDPPNSSYIAMLTDAHSEEINEIWPHRHKRSQIFVESSIQTNFGVGIFDSKTHELMAWTLHCIYGGLGILQTKEQHKKKGYGSLILKAATRILAERGEDAHLNVLPNNIASKALVEKLNYKFAFKSSWAFTKKRMLDNEL